MKNKTVNSARKNQAPAEKTTRKNFYIKAAACLLAAIFVIGNLPDLNITAAGTITGRVFQDFNGDGGYDAGGGTADAPEAIDAGVANVRVTAYDSGGAQRGFDDSAADGTYSISAGGTGPYRIEFTALPAGFQPSARNTNSLLNAGEFNSGTTVQFVADGATIDVNLAINRPEEYCQNNPNLATCRINAGAANGTFAGNPAIQSFAYDSGTVYTDTTLANYDAPTTHSVNVLASQVGSVWGLAYSRLNKRVYAAAYFKRYAGFGSGADQTYNAPPTTSDDPGAIYVVNPANNTIANRFTVPNATANRHTNANAEDESGDAAADNLAWNAVGKTSLGGIALADDESRLFVMNLEDKNLYALNPATGASLGNQLIPTPSNCAASATDIRPFAVKYYRGSVYVGMVCTAQSTQDAANLRAYVYQVNPTTLAFGTTPFTFSLNYNRGFANDPAPTYPAEWRPWTTTVQSNFAYPQPMLTDIEFDNGNLVLGIRDRAGDQGNDLTNRPAGDTLRACGSFTGTNFPGNLTLEANGRCGGAGAAPPNSGQGPGAAPGTDAGSGEFYYQDDFSNPANGANYHDEIVSGGLVHLPGYRQTVTTVFDPISRIVGSGETFDGGLRWLNSQTGATDKAYRLYNGDGDPATGGEFGKVNGLGDVIPLCDSAPIEIGNRVWRDANGNGVQDPQESRAGSDGVTLLGVTVRLYNSANVEIAEAQTDRDGEYYFTSGTAADPDITDNVGIVNGGILPNTAYQIRFDNQADFSTGALAGLVPTRANAAGQNGAVDSSDSDAVRVTNPTGSPANGTFAVITHTTGAAGANNHTLDAGFVAPVSIGSTVFNDVNNNGLQGTTGEPGIANVTVELRYDADNNGLIDGAETTAIASTTTSTGSGAALGNYFFGNLTPGNYQVRIPTPPSGFELSSLVTDTADNREDNDDNGSQTLAGGETLSPIINLTVDAEPTNAGTETAQGNLQDDANDNDGDMTVDFGFLLPTYSIGNRVWFDTNNNGQIEAVAGNTEIGIAGVSVSVFAGSDTNFTNALGTMNTDSLGFYRFDNLNAGTYVVRVNASNFAGGAALAGYANTTMTMGSDLDSAATAALNGEDGVNPTGAANQVQSAGIVSNAVTLANAAEPTGETDVQASGQGSPDSQANMTVDFGFYRMNLSGTTWNDDGGGTLANKNNGLLDTGERNYINVRVQLYSGTTEIPVGPDGILGTSDDAANGMLTNSLGNYNFQGLAPGIYRVVVIKPFGVNSSTGVGNNTDPEGNVDNDDNGFSDNTGNFANKIISGTITLTPGGETSFDNAIGSTSNPTVDFGFVALQPTVVELDKFDVYTDGKNVELRWSTGSEAGNLGFNIYREIGGKRELLNAAPIAGNALRSGAQLEASGDDYVWTIREAAPNAVYYLEDIDTDGSVNRHAGRAAEFRQTLDSQPNARTFADLANAGNSESLTETVDANRNFVPNAKQSAARMARQRQIAALGGAKITIERDDWYRISAGQLQAAGFDTNTDAQFWQLYADGAEVPFKLNSDSIEFFGRAVDTALTGKQTYYLINGQTGGLRVGVVEVGAAGAAADANSFGVTVERKDRQVYVSSVLNGDADNWFGAVVGRSVETVQNLNAVNVDGGSAARLSVKLQGIVAGAHVVSVRFNDTPLGSVEFDGFENKQFEFDLPASAVREGANRVYLQANGSSSDASLVDSIRLSYRRGYAANDNRIRFTVPANQTVRVGGFSDANISVYEIGGGAARHQVLAAAETVGETYGFSLSAANTDREMIAVVNSTIERASVTKNAASNWSAANNTADFVIVTSEELRESAGNLAAMREAQGLKTRVALVEDLFDEFSFGRPEPHAVKQFLQTAATEWQTKPRYALLFGDSSYDARNNLGLSETRDLVPTKLVDTEFMETSSDAWLADFTGDGAEDIALGRLPVGNEREATAAVEKLARFDGQSARREKIDLLIADSGFETHSDVLQTLLPIGVNSFRVDRAALGDAETHRRIVEQLNRNPLLVTYTGHGSQNVWASSSIFNSSDAARLSNSELSFYLLMNCLNGYTNQPTGESLAEALLKSTNGAVAVWTSSGVTRPDSQAAISRAFTSLAFKARAQKSLRVGDIVKAAKLASTDADVRRTWQLVGDPTVFIK